MNLRFQIEEQKRNSHMLGDFVIDTTYIKDLASKVFHADDKLGFFKKSSESARFVILLRSFFKISKTNYKLFCQEVRPCGVYFRMTSGMP